MEDNAFENYKKDIVNVIAYLLGLRADNNFDENKFNELDKNNNAKKIRALSILRTEFIRNFKEITARRNNLEPLENLNSLISVDLIKYLRENNMEIVHPNNNMLIHIAYVNEYILENIEGVKGLIPSWVKWDYVKSIFLMPGCYAGAKGSAVQNSNQAKKIQAAINSVRVTIAKNSSFYPYGFYVNWPTNKMEDHYGNILLNDEKFLKVLYSAHSDTFHANTYVIDATLDEKNSIYDFILDANNIAILVDCENVDPYVFASVFKNLEEENLKKIKKVILYDDVNTSEAWDYINELIHLPIVHNEIERVLDNKSLVDMAMIAGACKEYYEENTESLILVSSDSDFWALITNLKNAKFYILNESEKTSETIIERLDAENIEHCFMDSFAQAKVQDFKNMVLLKNLNTKIKVFNETGSFPYLNAKDLIDQIFFECHIQGNHYQVNNEKEAFYKKYLKNGFKINVDKTDFSLKMEINN